MYVFWALIFYYPLFATPHDTGWRYADYSVCLADAMEHSAEGIYLCERRIPVEKSHEEWEGQIDGATVMVFWMDDECATAFKAKDGSGIMRIYGTPCGRRP